MGMRIYDASDTFRPSDHGLKIGDEINIICVGGGQGGGGGHSYKGNGAASSFGNIVTAKGGSSTTGQYINPALTSHSGGCGGFILGANDWGGLGYALSPGQAGGGNPPPGSAGSFEAYPLNRYQGLSYGAGNSYSFGKGGGGYGAGGGSHGQATGGGSSGEVKYAVHKLTNLNNILVSVGGGGGGGTLTIDGKPGTTSGGGAGAPGAGKGGYGGIGGGHATNVDCGGGGAGGCVIVFW